MVTLFERGMEWYSCILREGYNYKTMTCPPEVIKNLQLCLPEILRSLRISLPLLKHQDAIYSSVLADYHIIRASLFHYTACRQCSSELGIRLGHMQDFSQCRCQFSEPEASFPATLSPRQPETGMAHSVVSGAEQPMFAKINSDWGGQKVVLQMIGKSPGWKGQPEKPGKFIPHLLVVFPTGRKPCCIRNAALAREKAPPYLKPACHNFITQLVC